MSISQSFLVMLQLQHGELRRQHFTRRGDPLDPKRPDQRVVLVRRRVHQRPVGPVVLPGSRHARLDGARRACRASILMAWCRLQTQSDAPTAL